MKRATTPVYVWTDLILPRLSLRCQAVARCVCKQWQGAVVDLWRQPHLVISSGERQISVLSQKCGWETVRVPKEVGVGTLLCVSEGLFCFAHSNLELGGHLIVGSPFTNRWKRLPPIPLPPIPPHPYFAYLCDSCLGCSAIGMIAHPASSFYTVLVLSAAEHACFAFEYASSSSSWSVYQCPSVPGCIPAGPHFYLTFLHGKAYYMSLRDDSDCRTNLASYDMVSHAWDVVCVLPDDVPVAVPPSGFQRSLYDLVSWAQVQLVNCNDELLLVGLHGWYDSRSLLEAWSYWSMRADRKHGLVLDSMESVPRHPTNPMRCPLRRCGEFAIAAAYADSSLSWMVFNNPNAKTVCYDHTAGSVTARFEPPGGKQPLEGFMEWTCNGAFHQPLLWNALL